MANAYICKLAHNGRLVEAAAWAAKKGISPEEFISSAKHVDGYPLCEINKLACEYLASPSLEKPEWANVYCERAGELALNWVWTDYQTEEVETIAYRNIDQMNLHFKEMWEKCNIIRRDWRYSYVNWFTEDEFSHFVRSLEQSELSDHKDQINLFDSMDTKKPMANETIDDVLVRLMKDGKVIEAIELASSRGISQKVFAQMCLNLGIDKDIIINLMAEFWPETKENKEDIQKYHWEWYEKKMGDVEGILHVIHCPSLERVPRGLFLFWIEKIGDEITKPRYLNTWRGNDREIIGQFVRSRSRLSRYINLKAVWSFVDYAAIRANPGGLVEEYYKAHGKEVKILEKQ